MGIEFRSARVVYERINASPLVECRLCQRSTSIVVRNISLHHGRLDPQGFARRLRLSRPLLVMGEVDDHMAPPLRKLARAGRAHARRRTGDDCHAVLHIHAVILFFVGLPRDSLGPGVQTL